MELQPISLETLSGIRHSASLPPHERFSQPEFLHVAFHGEYRPGAEGKPDALYITAAIAALDTAWCSEAFIVDLTDLKYNWGDEMSWLWSIGYQQTFRAQRPLAVIVGDSCRNALQTLDPDEYKLHAVKSFDDALVSIRRQKPEYDAKVAAFHEAFRNRDS
ncbi:hypothetical protein RMSM_01343 [Rhodopirellula maiorica SM1]|uniref:STAS/SEC14 domain-containing protein n=2 Tax=Novipirellula TaxID=2795426 RepID=M5RR87_9BACT|nr:hypothetical protein RMSM_01343 [Rhodopirellula maiorica SM1]